MTHESEMLSELQNISFLLGDLNAIRNGEYDPPQGADPNKQRREPRATLDDIFNRLGTVISLLERQNTMMYNIGINTAGDELAWQQQMRE